MNYAIVFRLLGYVLMIEGALLLLPAARSDERPCRERV